MSVKEEKKILRTKVRRLNNQISFAQKERYSASVLEKIEKLDVFIRSKTVLLYWSMDHEVFTHDFIEKWSKEKKILLPVTLVDELELREFTGKQNLQKATKLPLYEPIGEGFNKYGEINLAIVPGMAFDRHGHRLGHGRGYYDKLLLKMTAYKIGICFAFQLFDDIPHEDFDVNMDLVISK